MGRTIGGLQSLLDIGAVGSLSDGKLLDRFVSCGDASVFEEIVLRHGSMVRNVCRRILRDHHDAEDAFQATFLVLARRATTVQPRDRVVAWLYGVAFQTARKARANRARRRSREGQAPFPEPSETPRDSRSLLAECLDRELSRLPEKYRVPIVLCDLEGCSHQEAAIRLSCPVGTVSGRLSRARAMLARRLSRRNSILPVGVAIAHMAGQDASAGVSLFAARSILESARASAGSALDSTFVASEVVALARDVQGGMMLKKAQTIAAAVLAAGALATGAGLIARGQEGGPPMDHTPRQKVERIADR